LIHDITSLTYQSVATFDPDAEVDDDGLQVTGHAHRLTPAARGVFDRLRELGEVTLVLDECHHLLAVWGELLQQMLAELPKVRVLGLTATPAGSLTESEAALARSLLGDPVYEASIPALIKEGYLAPYAEFAWLCQPTAAEQEWLATNSERFAEVKASLTAPEFASTPFFEWLDVFTSRFSASEWSDTERRRPEVAVAVMRAHGEGLVEAPEGARSREAFRQPMTADDWAVLMGEFASEVLRESEDERDASALAELRRALPAIGYRLTGSGVSRGRSPVDRVVARSEAKSRATVEIVAAESLNIPRQMRALVLCDHEHATATVPAALRNVINPQAGSARQVAGLLAGDMRLAGRGVALVTGSTVAANARGAAILRAARPDVPWHTDGTLTYFGGGLTEDASPDVPGWSGSTGWGPRTWVPLVTQMFSEGALSVLVGTRALLGEGWNAPAITTVVDLSTATTSTAVVQIRGRALRLDPGWSDKVAHTWTPVCVAPGHARGLADYERLVRKHEGYFGLDDLGEVVAGLRHIDSSLSPFAAPPEATFDAFNAHLLVRAEGRADTRQSWRIGAGFEDVVTPSLQVAALDRTGSASGAGAGAGVPGADAAAGSAVRVRPTPTGLSKNVARWRPGAIAALAGLALAAVAALFLVPDRTVGIGLFAVLAIAAGGAGAWLRRAADTRVVVAYHEAAADPGVATYAAVIASALGHPDGVRFRVRDHVTLIDLPGPAAQDFAGALDELLNEPGRPRYVIARPVLEPLPIDRGAAVAMARRAAVGELDVPLVCHAVPTVFGVNAEALTPFVAAWQRHIADTTPLFTRSPAGAALLAAAEPASPAGVATAVRVTWE
jgi:hypothetical protein